MRTNPVQSGEVEKPPCRGEAARSDLAVIFRDRARAPFGLKISAVCFGILLFSHHPPFCALMLGRTRLFLHGHGLLILFFSFPLRVTLEKRDSGFIFSIPIFSPHHRSSSSSSDRSTTRLVSFESRVRSERVNDILIWAYRCRPVVLKVGYTQL